MQCPDNGNDGPYGSVTGGSPWTDVNTFKENGKLTAIEIRVKEAEPLVSIRARYSTIQLFVRFGMN